MEEEQYGPLMAALDERRRNFIKAMLSNPWGNGTDWAKAAGYSNTGESGKTQAYRLTHDPRIMAAAREYAAGHFLDEAGVTMAIAVLIQELSNVDAKVRLSAANSILDRGGVSAKTEHRVVVTHSVEDMEKIAHRLAVELGVEPMKLIGGNTTAKNITGIIPDDETVSKTGGDAGHKPMRAERHGNAPVLDAVSHETTERPRRQTRPDEPTSGELARGTVSPPGAVASTQVQDVIEVGRSFGPTPEVPQGVCVFQAMGSKPCFGTCRIPKDCTGTPLPIRMDIDNDLAF